MLVDCGVVPWHQQQYEPGWWFFTNPSEKICERQIGVKIFPNFRGENSKKIFELPPPSDIWMFPKLGVPQNGWCISWKTLLNRDVQWITCRQPLSSEPTIQLHARPNAPSKVVPPPAKVRFSKTARGTISSGFGATSMRYI